MKIVTLFLFLSLTGFSQNGKANFEFNLSFIDEIAPFKELTKDKFIENRRDLRIKSIKIHVDGNQSLDSLYLKNNEIFNKIIDENSFGHSNFPYVQFYDFHETGALICLNKYPICNYLSKNDSVKCKRDSITINKENNKTVISKYFNRRIKDSLFEKLVFEDNKLIYKLEKYIESITREKPDNKILAVVFTKEEYHYEYLKNGKKFKTQTNNNVFCEYEYLKNRIRITCNYTDEYDKEHYVFQNVLRYNSKNNLKKATFFDKNQENVKAIYSLSYDKHGNIEEIKRRNVCKGFFDYSEILYRYENFYEKNILVKTIVHYNFNVVANDVIYTYYENGLVKTISKNGKTEFYEYSFF